MSIIQELMTDSSVSRFTDENGICYGIKVLGRGENLFFQEQGDGFVCVFDAVHQVLYTRSIKSWDGQGKMSASEKDRTIKVLGIAYKNIFKKELTTTDSKL